MPGARCHVPSLASATPASRSQLSLAGLDWLSYQSTWSGSEGWGDHP